MITEVALKLFEEQGPREYTVNGALSWRRAAIASLMLQHCRRERPRFPMRRGVTTTSPAAFQRELAENFDRRRYEDSTSFRSELWSSFRAYRSTPDGKPSVKWLTSFAVLCLALDLRWKEDFTVTAEPVIEPVYKHERWVDGAGRRSAARVRVL